jgi:hypothetical protein
MPKRMMVCASAILAIISVAFAMAGRTSQAQQAAGTCLSKPGGSAPEGRHWFYRIDRATRRHCWYLGDIGTKARHTVVPTRLSFPRPAPKLAAAKSRRSEVPVQVVDEPSAAAVPKLPAIEPKPMVSFRWPENSRTSVNVASIPSSVSSSFAQEPQASTGDDDMPLIWPVLGEADLAATASPSTWTATAKTVVPLVLGAVAFATLFGCVFSEFLAVRRQRRVADQLRRVRLEQTGQQSGGRRPSALSLPLSLRPASGTSSSGAFGAGAFGSRAFGSATFSTRAAGDADFPPVVRPRRSGQ